MAFSPDGKTLVSAARNETILLWNVETREPIVIFQEHIYESISATFSPDGKTLASGTEDGTILLWDVSLGHKHRHFGRSYGLGLVSGVFT